VHTTTIDRAAFSAWSEGWHTTGDGASGNVFVDYPGLGLHASAMPLSTTQALITAMTDDFAAVNHISISATSYTTQAGARLVHYSGARHGGRRAPGPLQRRRPRRHDRDPAAVADRPHARVQLRQQQLLGSDDSRRG